VQEGRWVNEIKDYYFSEGLLEQAIGLVGFGMVARFLVKMLIPFNTKIKVFDPYVDDKTFFEYGVERAALEDIFTTSKIISVHAAKTKENFHMIDEKLLGKIPAGALFVNTSRGSIIDQKALEDELQTGRFKAVLDVFETEPLPPESRLRGLKNVLLMPHLAGPTVDRRKKVTMGLIDDIKSFINGGKLKYEIDKDYANRMTGS
jgi:phosphoglycerate dehydrogenase-like enzyme